MEADLESAPQKGVYNPGGRAGVPGNTSRNSLASSLAPSEAGIGPALSSNGTSIRGDPDNAFTTDEWGPEHPCFPHLNPHVPMTSPLYQSTRIIRVKRDWMVAGDLAPAFSNLYPEILEEAGLEEGEFRHLIEYVNGVLVNAFDPWSLRNWFDGLMGCLTGWLWEDLGITGIKGKLKNLESWIEDWNRRRMGKGAEMEEGRGLVRVIGLRNSGYMTVSQDWTS
jgi:hypothetical protein